MTPLGFKLGLAGMERYNRLRIKLAFKEVLVTFCRKFSVSPDSINNLLVLKETSRLKQNVKLDTLIRRPQLSIFDFLGYIPKLEDIFQSIELSLRQEVFQAAEILLKYSGYIDRESVVASKLTRLEDLLINDKFNYNGIDSLSTEARQKLQKVQPLTIGQASRIPGVSPSDINVLLVLMGR